MNERTNRDSVSPASVRPVLSPVIRRLLWIFAAGFALLVANSLYLVGVRLAGTIAGRSAETPFSLGMFLLHVLLGLALVLPFVAFSLLHGARGVRFPNRRAALLGIGVAATGLVVALTGILLTRVEGYLDLRDPRLRSVLFGVHVVAPLVAGWLYLVHRRRGKPMRRGTLSRWVTVAAGLFAVAVAIHLFALRRPAPESAETIAGRFAPSLAKTASGRHLDADLLMADSYCQQCHQDTHAAWAVSAHRFSSFNNPAYKFSVLETREFAQKRDGNLDASRWCAGCHDPVPFFSGRFDRADFDTDHDPTALAGLTCTSCHAIQSVDSNLGNADFTIDEPEHYPFAFSDSATLRWLNRQLVRARPDLHKSTFLKPFHRTAEFCSTCHKVHLPPELNGDRWLRGQNHFDSFRMSGAPGHSASSFYYPEKAFDRCADCHMPLVASDDFGARDFDGKGRNAIHDHQAPAANTGLGALVGWPQPAIEKTRAFLKRAMRVDLFGLREGGELEGALVAPLGPERPVLVPGRTYLLEAVVRNLFTGHEFTQGTADSNEVWLRLEALRGEERVAVSGGMRADRSVDPRSYFLNAWVIDRDGHRIDRRNPQNIFTVLFSHQMPPGAASVVPFRLTVPARGSGPLTLRLTALYRKFDNTYFHLFAGADRTNDLPVEELSTTAVTFDVAGDPAPAGTAAESPIPLWQRWNDYGIGLLRQSGPMARGSKEAALAAFAEVEKLGRPDGPLNQIRVLLTEGEDVGRARAALTRARAFDPPSPPWLLAWFEAQVSRREGNLDRAIAALRELTETPWPEARARGFDFSGDDRVWLQLGQLELERIQERPEGDPEIAAGFARAAAAFETVLAHDSENALAHYSLARIARARGDSEAAERSLARFEYYRGDDPDRDRARDAARRSDPIADFQAEPVVIYELEPTDGPPRSGAGISP
ncbi:MAG: multiheme c-type cytochrome [Thermoanaerobaculia bacterium]